MATRKRTSSRSRRSGLVGRAVSAGRKALREAESRVPPDLRKQLERTIKDGQKTLASAIDQLQAQVRSRAKQADVDKVLKRLDSLSKQVQQVARGASSRGATTKRRAKPATAKRTARSTTRKAAPRKPATRKASTRSTAAARPSSSTGSSSTARSTAPRRRASKRPTSPAPEGPKGAAPPGDQPSWMPESNDSGSSS